MRLVIFLIVCAACAKTPNLPLRPDSSPPADSTVSTFTAGDGTQLLARHWAPHGNLKATVVIMHGLKDYSARYDHLAHRLADAGYSVYAFDMRGHAHSAGPRVAPADWQDYVDDLDRFLTHVEQLTPGKPVYLFGHSMGGAIAALAAERHRPELAGLILSGPALAVDAPPLQIAGAMMASVLTPKAPALALDNHDFSSDPAVAAQMDKDDLISNPPAPASTAAGLIDGMRQIWEGADALTMPVLAMHGSNDKLTAPWGSRALIDRIPAHDKTLAIYEGYNHDLVHEPDGKGPIVEKDIVLWLDAHEGGTAFVVEPWTKRLAGHPRGWTQAVEIAGGIGDNTTFAGRLAAELARPQPLGWHGGLVVERIGGLTTVALQPVGVAVRLKPVIVGVAGGASLVSGDGQSLAFALSGSAWAEVAELGPVHASGFFEIDHPTGSSVNYYEVGGSLRLGRDRAYWPRAHAGWGPLVTGGVAGASTSGAGSSSGWFVMVGLELYGAD